VRDMSFNRIDVDILSAAHVQTSDYTAPVEAITDLWQFWIDPAMIITIILLPGDADFAHFPLGEHTLGSALFEAMGISAVDSSVINFNRRFHTRKKILNSKFVSKDARGAETLLVVSGMPLWNDDGCFEGYRCTVIDGAEVVASTEDSET
jgi:hypothetical protein